MSTSSSMAAFWQLRTALMKCRSSTDDETLPDSEQVQDDEEQVQDDDDAEHDTHEHQNRSRAAASTSAADGPLHEW